MELTLNKDQWKKVKLDDLLIKREENDKENARNRFDRFLKVEHMDAESLHLKRWSSQESGDKINPTFYKVFRKGQILFPTRNPHLRRTVLAPFDGICGEKTLTLEPIEDQVDPMFLPFVFHSESFYEHTTNAIVGSTNPHVRWRDVANYEFLLPPKSEQARLTELLWAMDEVIEREREVLERVETIKKCLFKKFTAQGENWTKYKIGDLMHFHYGSALKESDRIDGEYSVITSSGFQGTHTEFVSKGPGIVVGRKGNVGQVTWVENNFWTTDTAYFIEVKKEFEQIPLKFIYYLLIAADLKKHSIATAVPGLNRDDALMTKIYIPSFEEIISYLERFSALDEKLSEIQIKINSSKALQKSLINQIF